MNNYKKISLALGGGGAKGNAHIGVIRRLQIEGFQIEAIAGTSFGGIVSVFHSLGYSPDQIEELFSSIDQDQLYGQGTDEGPSLLGLDGATRWLKKSIGNRTFADLKLPTALVSADLRSGREIILNDGPLVDALLATIAVPGIFPAKHIGDFELVDGGTLDPVPVAPARALRPELPVVGVVLSRPMGKPAQAWNIPLPEYLPRTLIERISKMRYSRALDVFLRSLDMVTRAVTEYRLEVDKPDIILRPAVTDIDILDKVVVAEVAKLGEDVVQEMLPELNRLFNVSNRFRRMIGI